MPSTSTRSSNLPPAETRQRLEERLTDLIDALAADARMQASPRHPTLHHVWDFAQRTRYMLSEVDNVAAGRALRFPEQMVAVQGIREGTPNPAKAKEVMTDVAQRSVMLDLLVSSPNPMMMMIMGLEDVDFGDEIKRKAAAVAEAAAGLQ
ncbi:2f8e56ec-aae2-453b-bf8e-d34814733133 [Thermothielavioides terrestris]|uniref:Uncharacterized protein n=2 Tax=Thermothielavioides terrestris TaxID=2587410 RepID=G2R9T9_THETT|nr:uncharacterized protein THITE_2091069 [Thermothielavioides terrestris NRRL 8126]AEO69580.1 hypothetical protein THITE_2091069 [Thermothielavioides terrestris NRRL 8126]SPQ26101.1 2f8e56ec-aae2-453b-bf8e-d34814733133 [Thermothielavioides terrestris]